MLNRVDVTEKHLKDYWPIVGERVIEEILSLAKPLRGAHVLHVNSTSFGGGVAEILHTLVPLMRDVGLNAEWQVIKGKDEFFNVTKAMHNGLQGMSIPFTDEMMDIWKHYNRLNAKNLEGEYDFIVVHDPQPAGLLHFTGGENGKWWIWRCHIDTSNPNTDFWNFLAPYIAEYPSLIFTMRQYIGPGIPEERVHLITPTIDPLSPKNVPMPLEEARSIVSRYGFAPERPLMVQVSRFDPWKDPLGVIDCYRKMKHEVPKLQLALVGSMAADDPEGWDYYDRTVRHAGEDYDIRILHNFHGVGNREVNAFQTAADVVVQKSLREGFGLVVTEALWKGKPVVGSNVGGIPLQIINGETGFLVESVEECAGKALFLLQNPDVSKRMGEAARERVRRNYLSTRHLADYLKLFGSLIS